MIPHFGQIANAFVPSDSDWMVSITYLDGRVRTRRITPGTVTEEQAVGYALAAEQARMADVDSWSIRRVSDRRVVAPDDSFAEFLKRRRQG
jgi:hypothetical protein